MADGTVMEGKTHSHDDEGSHGEGTHGERAAAGPSEAAAMICTGQVVDDVARIMGRDEIPEPTASWESPLYTCTFALPDGPLVLTVHDAAEEALGRAHFEGMRAAAPGATPIKGVYSLGLPAYETRDSVAFVKDGKTLEVDASGLGVSGLGGRLGVEGDQDRGEIAYAVATSVLSCWTEHA